MRRGVLGAVLFVCPLSAEVLYEQISRSDELNGLRSHVTREQQAADNFILQTPALIEKVGWHGFFFPDAPLENSVFHVRIFNGTLSSLDSSPFYQTQGIADHQIAFAIPFGAPGETHPVHSFSLVLPAPVLLESKRAYWLSITADIPPSGPYFCWLHARSGLLNWATVPIGGREWLVTEGSPTELAFKLEGTVVPEPDVGVLMLLGIFAFLLARLHNPSTEGLCKGCSRVESVKMVLARSDPDDEPHRISKKAEWLESN